jgi:hypothetical protein
VSEADLVYLNWVVANVNHSSKTTFTPLLGYRVVQWNKGIKLPVLDVSHLFYFYHPWKYLLARTNFIPTQKPLAEVSNWKCSHQFCE